MSAQTANSCEAVLFADSLPSATSRHETLSPPSRLRPDRSRANVLARYRLRRSVAATPPFRACADGARLIEAGIRAADAPRDPMLQSLLAEGRPLLADGATGTNLFAMGLTSGETPELWNAEHPDRIRSLHQAFVDAGSDIILTNTFGGNRRRLMLHGLEDARQRTQPARRRERPRRRRQGGAAGRRRRLGRADRRSPRAARAADARTRRSRSSSSRSRA